MDEQAVGVGAIAARRAWMKGMRMDYEPVLLFCEIHPSQQELWREVAKAAVAAYLKYTKQRRR